MKKLGVLIWVATFLLVCGVFYISRVEAQSGCCSWHGGESWCSSSGRTICGDGTLSPSCTCSSYGGSSGKIDINTCGMAMNTAKQEEKQRADKCESELNNLKPVKNDLNNRLNLCASKTSEYELKINNQISDNTSLRSEVDTLKRDLKNATKPDLNWKTVWNLFGF